MPQKITIRPLDPGWAVELDQLDAPMVFRSGAQAERAARALAVRLSDAGESAELVIHLRDGTLAGRFVAAPPTNAAKAPGLSGKPGARPERSL